MTTTQKKNEVRTIADDKPRPLPLVETLVFDIVNYLLDHEGYGYSTDIAQEMLRLKPRRYTSREVIGILRNRPMFRHAQSKERRGGIRWRLDLLALKKYLIQKGYEDRADARNLYSKIRNLKWRQMNETIKGLQQLLVELQTSEGETEDVSDETLDYCYEYLAKIWS
jgi:hypothetical protein|tara:strand:- start:241 stop:741 length:501 start_codon:yes stop_codon:yes gene_type:complete